MDKLEEGDPVIGFMTFIVVIIATFLIIFVGCNYYEESRAEEITITGVIEDYQFVRDDYSDRTHITINGRTIVVNEYQQELIRNETYRLELRKRQDKDYYTLTSAVIIEGDE